MIMSLLFSRFHFDQRRHNHNHRLNHNHKKMIILRRLIKESHRENIYHKTLLFARISKAAPKGGAEGPRPRLSPPDAARPNRQTNREKNKEKQIKKKEKKGN